MPAICEVCRSFAYVAVACDSPWGSQQTPLRDTIVDQGDHCRMWFWFNRTPRSSLQRDEWVHAEPGASVLPSRRGAHVVAPLVACSCCELVDATRGYFATVRRALGAPRRPLRPHMSRGVDQGALPTGHE